MHEPGVARSELILGAAASGKTQRVRSLVGAWTAASPQHQAVYIDAASAWDVEMRAFIDRQRSVPAAPSRVQVEQPVELAHALGVHGRPDTLVVVDCLTFWLTATLMQALAPDGTDAWEAGVRPPLRLVDAVRACAGPLVLVSSRLVTPASTAQADLRSITDTLDEVDQQAVGACDRVTLMSAGLALTLKEPL
jgi:adenosylcobinamide kinase / adenosylcobinamide-phosphate guanylyltransferase